AVAEPDQLALQRLEILDDPVMNDRDLVGGDRVGVGFGRQAVRRPPGVADTNRAAHRFALELGGKVAELALGAPPLYAAADQSRDPGGIVTAVLEAPE